MSVNPHRQRAEILLEQSRPELAEKELRAALLDDPQDSITHSYLAIALLRQDKNTEADKEANLAIQLQPDEGYPYYVKALVLEHQDKYEAAKAHIRTALQLEPTSADFYGLLSGLHIAQKDWADALEASENGLMNEPEHVRCNNYRALALTKLGREVEAAEDLQDVLASDPENALSHANRGWALLHGGDHEQALIHFREALRLEPEFQWARQGVVEALNARNIIYRIFLKYLLWMSGLKTKTQWYLIIGLYVGNRILRGISKSNPAISPFIEPVLWAYFVFVIFSWTARPFFNFLLRIHPIGKLALSKDQIRASNAVAVCMLGVLSAIPLYFLGFGNWFLLAIGSLILMLPVSAPFSIAPGKYKYFLAVLSMILVLVFVSMLALLQLGYQEGGDLIPIFFLGCFGYTWLANIGISRS